MRHRKPTNTLIRITLDGQRGHFEKYFKIQIIAVLYALLQSFLSWDSLDLEVLTQADIQREIFAGGGL